MEIMKNISWNVVNIVSFNLEAKKDDNKEICLCCGEKKKMSAIDRFLCVDCTEKMSL